MIDTGGTGNITDSRDDENSLHKWSNGWKGKRRKTHPNTDFSGESIVFLGRRISLSIQVTYNLFVSLLLEAGALHIMIASSATSKISGDVSWEFAHLEKTLIVFVS